MSKKHMGSKIDDFLKEEGIFEETQAQAIKEVIAWQLAEAMKKQNISKNRMAVLMGWPSGSRHISTGARPTGTKACGRAVSSPEQF